MPVIVGVLNVTPDSFSDGGQHADVSAAVEFGCRLCADGAEIIDIGGESTRPGAEPVALAEERERVLPVLEQLHTACPQTLLSIDTYHAETARAACAAGAAFINDVSGFRDPAMIQVAKDTGATCVLMHKAGEPRTMQDAPVYDDVVQEVGDYLLEGAACLEAAGISPERIILDPGFGFGKTREHNLRLYLRFGELARRLRAEEDYRLLIGISRKRLIDELLGIENPQERDLPSAQLAAALAASGAGFLRVHDPRATLQAVAQQKAAAQEVHIALGSNLGDTRSHLRAALRELEALPLTSLDAVATPVLTEPAYDTDQQPFLNTVCRLRTKLGPYALFAYLQALENVLGRVKTRSKGPRSIDIDLLSYGQHVIKLPRLEVPHPRLAERAFVVEPLLEITPDFRLPDGQGIDPARASYGRVIEHDSPVWTRSSAIMEQP